MPEFVRLPNSIINLSLVGEIQFEGDLVLLRWTLGHTSQLRGADAAVLLDTLEQRYGVMSDSAARLLDEEAMA